MRPVQPKNSGHYAGIRRQPHFLDCTDRALLIDIRRIAADPHCAQHLAALIPYQHATRRRHHRPLTQAIQCSKKRRSLLCIQRQQARPLAQGDRAPGLARGHVGANQAGTVLALQGQHMPAGIEHRHRQRRGVDLAARSQRGVHQADCDLEVQSIHGKVLFLL